VLSHEIAQKQGFRDQFRHGSNVFLVDPLQRDELAATIKTVLEHPVTSRRVGMNGYQDFSAEREDFASYAQKLAALFSTIRQDVEFRRKMMSVAEMQACLARLYVDDAYRTLFYLVPEMPQSEYQLTEEELKALKNIDKKMLSLFAVTLKTKRKEKFQSAYPLLFNLPGVDVERYYNRFYHLYPARPQETTLSQVLAFGEFIEECLATDTDAPPYASDLVRYERLYYSAEFSPAHYDSLRAINHTEKPPKEVLSMDAQPVVREGIQFATFTYDVIKIAAALQEQQELPDIQKGVYYIIFQQQAGVHFTSIFAIAGATNKLLSLCDGSRRVSHIICEMEQHFGKTSLTSVITRTLLHLLSIRVIEV
jgi:hypothetical protein